MIDIHSFDGRWEFIPHTDISNFSRNNKLDLLLWLLDQLSEVSLGLELVLDDIDTENNNDTTHNVKAEDILVCICLKLKEMKQEDREEYYKLINEQMTDMYHLGRCAIGRTARLYQIYKTML
jgi:hypothetical protein